MAGLSILGSSSVKTFWDKNSGKFVAAKYKPTGTFNKSLSSEDKSKLKHAGYSDDSIKLMVSICKESNFPLGLLPLLTQQRNVFGRTFISIDNSGSMQGYNLKELKHRLPLFAALECAIGRKKIILSKINNIPEDLPINNTSSSVNAKKDNIETMNKFIASTRANGTTPTNAQLNQWLRQIDKDKIVSKIDIYFDGAPSDLSLHNYSDIKDCWNNIYEKAKKRAHGLRLKRDTLLEMANGNSMQQQDIMNSNGYKLLEKELTEVNKHLVTILTCDSKSIKNMAYLLESRNKALSYIHFHVCTNKEKDVEFINIFDYYITNDGNPNNFGVGVSDDAESEAEEILLHQVGTITKAEAKSAAILGEHLSFIPAIDNIDEKPLPPEFIQNLHSYRDLKDAQFSIEQQKALLQHQNTFNNSDAPPAYEFSQKATHEVKDGQLIPLK